MSSIQIPDAFFIYKCTGIDDSHEVKSVVLVAAEKSYQAAFMCERLTNHLDWTAELYQLLEAKK